MYCSRKGGRNAVTVGQNQLGSGFCQVHSAVKAMCSSWLGSLPPHPNNWAMATKTGNQEISSIQTRVLDTARILGCQGGDFCQPQLWKHRFTLDTRGSRSPFPLTREEEEKPKFTTKKQDSERGFLQTSRKKASPSPSAPSSAISGPFFLWGLRMSTPLEFSMKKPNTQRQESTRARECRCQFGQVLQFNSMKS